MGNVNPYKLFPISGAAVATEIEHIGEYFVFPEINEEYKQGLFHEGLLWASKDGKIYVLAFEVDIKGKRYTHFDLREMMRQEEK